MAAWAVVAFAVADYNAVGDAVVANSVLSDDAVVGAVDYDTVGQVGDGDYYGGGPGAVGGEQVADEPDNVVVEVEAGDVGR